MNPRFPVYVVSKGRWKRHPTIRVLEELGVPYYVIVEEDEYYEYSTELDIGGEILVLPKHYKDDYDTFWKDDDPRTGPGPARNYAWDHSVENKHEWHWVLDDNIESLERFNNNMKVKCLTPTPFYVMEEFTLRYTNVAQAGPAYAIFCPSGDARPPVAFNTRIYSFLLIRNDIPYRWRGRYNEDTDLSIRAMKDGWCTIQFNMFLQGKRATQTVGGGNTAEFYDGEGTRNKSQMLVDMHPDYAKLSTRFNRVHHQVDYKGFKENNKLIRDPARKIIITGINDFGMVRRSKEKDDHE